MNRATPWREALGIAKHEEQGLVLQGMRIRAGMTQKELAEFLGVKRHQVSEMEHGRRSIGREMAHRMAEIFGTRYNVFLNEVC